MEHKTIVSINSINYLSTGNIMCGIAENARAYGYKVITYSPAGRTQKKTLKYHRFIGSIIERYICCKINYFTGNQGSLFLWGTKKFLKEMDKLKPDIIHLHNLHSNYINLKMLFTYIKKNNIKVIWTLHDCWVFTGHCPYFDIVKCEKWKNHCMECPMYRLYPAPWSDTSKKMFYRKKKLFTSVKSMVIIPPSRWLSNLVKQSFLKDYPIQVICNGIDFKIFYPRESDFKERNGLAGKFIIMGCAASWGERKGQDRFEILADRLDENYKIVLVGIEKCNVKNEKIFCIKRTTDQNELAEIYSVADVFLNPTREDNFPTVNIEALSCGTPVLSYGAGGSAEAFDEKSGMIVNDENLVETIELLRIKNFREEDCIARGRQFDQKTKFMEYVELYDELLREK